MEQKTIPDRNYCYISFMRILTIIACILLATAPVSSSDQQASDTRIVVDGYGNQVSVPNEVNKVVVLMGACNVPSIMSALGVGNKLIEGLCSKNPMQIKVQPEYAQLNTVKLDNGNANVEDLLKLNPDVVIGWSNLKNRETFLDAGLPLVIFNTSRLDSTMRSIVMVAEVTGSQKQGKELLDYFDDTIQMIDEKLESIPPEQRKKVLLVSNTDPITVFAADSNDRDLIEKAGGISVTNDIPGYSVETDMEQLLTLDPDIIIVSSTNSKSYDEIMNNPTWDVVRAKKEGQIYLTPTGIFYWNRTGPEIPLYLLWQANLFYPDLFSADLVKEETKKYYAKFLNYDLSDDDYQMILTSEGV